MFLPCFFPQGDLSVLVGQQNPPKMSNPMDSLNYFRLSGLFCDIKLWAKKPNGPLYQMQGGPYQVSFRGS